MMFKIKKTLVFSENFMSTETSHNANDMHLCASS